jgi:hypothetical protein
MEYLQQRGSREMQIRLLLLSLGRANCWKKVLTKRRVPAVLRQGENESVEGLG